MASKKGKNHPATLPEVPVRKLYVSEVDREEPKVKGEAVITPEMRQAWVLYHMNYKQHQIASMFDVSERCARKWIARVRDSKEFDSDVMAARELASHALQAMIPSALNRFRKILEFGEDKDARQVAESILKTFDIVKDKRTVENSDGDLIGKSDSELIERAKDIIAGRAQGTGRD